jgi:predicted nucleic acid-binding protein
MTPVFADTYYWLALINPRDHAHQEAVALAQSLTQPLFTTYAVLTEVGDAMCHPANRASFLILLRDIDNDPLATIVPADPKWFDRGVALYAARPDKGWSLTDCISFCVMQEHRLIDALTGDGDFSQAGFRPLMAKDK